ncbi:MAG TPA: rod shape-determining protein RodA, partial [Bryobacteraceae bacterium]|nr:rod shape-determining protein RodA [Bryobacteraceae bacterium]
MSGYLNVRDIDWGMLVIVLVICALGVVQIFSATLGTSLHEAWWKQIIWVGLGILLMWLATSIDYHAL